MSIIIIIIIVMIQDRNVTVQYLQVPVSLGDVVHFVQCAHFLHGVLGVGVDSDDGEVV